ncbi:MAG: DNA polymerase Y family protein [Acidimicrobiia bacterium]|nr:DNA polymerase Y family protein [Acidimicrobiia bacterium]
MTAPTRTLALWCPAWAVATARCVDPALADVPVAVVERGKRGLVVRAASTEARAEGVTVGLRRREAESRCAELVVVDADPAAEARTFEAVARAMDPITPGVVLERPGVLTFPTRGPSRYFGGDDALSVRVLDAVASAGITSARVGVADGSFAARLAARTAGPAGARIVVPEGTPAFLAPWPVGVLSGVVGRDGAKPWPDGREGGAKSTSGGGDDLVSLLVRLGLPALGDFAALPASSVLARFGTDGARAHRLAQGLDEHAAPPAPPPPDLVETCEFDPPATRVDEVAFATKGLADRLLSRLERLGLACTQVVVEAETEHGEHLVRCWRHEGALTPAALVARVRWQLDGWLTQQGGLSGALTLVRLAPDRVVPAAVRQLGFWGGDAAAHDRADRALARLQGMLGHDGVVTAVVTGGRAPSERVRWVPWGEPRDDRVAPGAEVPTWPGAIPGPAPARVHAPPLPAELLDADGAPLAVSGRGEASAAPARLRCDALSDGGGAVTAWAGPWAHDLRWWDRVTHRRRALWQVVVGDDDAQVACLVAVENGRAGVEAVYD